MLIIKHEFSESIPFDLVGGWVLHDLGKGLDNLLEWHILLLPPSGLLELKSFLVFGSHIYLYSHLYSLCVWKLVILHIRFQRNSSWELWHSRNSATVTTEKNFREKFS